MLTHGAASEPRQHGNKLERDENVPAEVSSPDTERLAINTIRVLAADLCEQYSGGHPGTVMGAAAIGVALWRYQLRYNPSNPEWFNRDRFVLSAGHASLLQYILLHLSGYSSWTLDEIKKYHASRMDVIATGHPEIEFPGIEVTTGPLGQGVANAVGMAMAGKQIAALFNRPDFPLMTAKVWCFAGDGCLQEGVAHEAISMAGHFGLDNLVLVYDNNAVTLDGGIEACFTEDVNARFRACGWDVIDVYDGSNDLQAIVQAFREVETKSSKPVMINIRTIIGFGSSKQNSGAVHGAALGSDDLAHVKEQLGFDPKEHFVVPQEVYRYFAPCIPRGKRLEEEWNGMMGEYRKQHPDLWAELQRRLAGTLNPGWVNQLPAKAVLPQGPIATRKASGIAINALVPCDPILVAGSADLQETTNLGFKGQVEYQNPKSGLGDYTGRQIRFGIREFAMVAAGNGMVAFHKGFFVPIMSTFLMFWLYAAPAARMGALQKLQWIGIATHDSISTGDNGPTHQPVALSAFYRALPDMNFIRPADAEETMGAYMVALECRENPSILSLSRHALPLLPGTDRTKVAFGAYVVHGNADQMPDMVLLATGGEVWRAVEVAKRLEAETGYSTRVVSMPSFKHFDRQPRAYRLDTIPSDRCLVISIENWVSHGWSQYAHAGCHMHTFGRAAPEEILYDHFGFGVDNLVERITHYALSKRCQDGWKLPGVGDFENLLADHLSSDRRAAV